MAGAQETKRVTRSTFRLAPLSPGRRPESRNSALVEAGFDWRFSPQARLGAFYQAELAAHAESHAVKGAFTWDF